MNSAFLFFSILSLISSSVGLNDPTRILGTDIEKIVEQKNIKPIKSPNQLGVKIEAKSGIVIDVETGKILFSKNEDFALPMASLTKLMTSLTVFYSDQYHPEDEVKISRKAALLRWQGADIKLNEGEVILAKDLLRGVLIASANDASCAMAEYIGGSETEFVAKMNQKAQTLGLTNSIFMNSHGLDQEGHYSTAYDLALITRELLKFPEFIEIVSTSEYEFNSLEPASYYHRFRNTNKLLDLDFMRIIGGKTGFTDQAGFCLMLLGEKDGHKIISVVLGSNDAFFDSKILMDWIEEAYEWKDG